MIWSSNQQLQQELEYTLLKADCHSWWISKMQSGREDTLEEWYAIRFCFKIGNNATEKYEMLLTAFGPFCMNRASVFEWHKRFKERRESVWNGEMCWRSKEIRTPELLDQIKNFMDKDRRVSIETITAQFNVSVGTVHTIIREKLKIQKICAKFVQRVLREDQRERRCHDNREMVELINSVLFQTLLSSVNILFVYTQLNVKIVLFQAIQFRTSSQFSSIWPIDRTLTGATTAGQSRPGSNGNKGVLCIP